MKKIGLLIAVLLISACDSEKEGLAELKRLCEKDAGLKIYKTVKADGYYDTTGGFDLVESPYIFYEFCQDSSSRFDVIPVPGCYRVEKARRESGQCNKRYDDAMKKVVVGSYPEFIKEYCISVEKIENPTARYSYHSSPKAWSAKNDISEFRRSDSYIRDNATSEIISSYVSYSFNNKPGLSSPRSCHVIDDKYISYAEAKLVETTIIPVQGEMK